MQLRDDSWQEVADIACVAAKAITLIAERTFDVQHKTDKSPVTSADLAAHNIIVAGLKALTPEIPIISEEDETHAAVAEYWWCIDPLDGTRSFVRGSGEYTVNIALMRGDAPILGVIACPLDGAVYAGVVGVGMTRGAWRMCDGQTWEALPIAHSRTTPRAIVSSAHPSKKIVAYLEAHGVSDRMHMSSARKFCVVAEGGADLYPRCGPTMEWDTAAGHAIILALGGTMTTLDGQPFTYGKAGFRNGDFVVSL